MSAIANEGMARRPAGPVSARLRGTAAGQHGIYLHIPFCRTRCNYCHFVTRRWRADSAERYCAALLREIDHHFADGARPVRADSVYFGGGTPSLVTTAHIEAFLRSIRGHVTLSEKAEITLEANPGDVTPAKAHAYRRLGINRVSVGAQTFDEAALSAIGRDHSSADIGNSVRNLRAAGIENINLDLMLGLPDQTEQRWVADLENALRLGPRHISVYMMDLDDHSPLLHLSRKGRFRLPEDDAIADLFLRTIGALRIEGYRRYEISNFALEGFQSSHNLKYWKMLPFLGFGVGSHSCTADERYANRSGMSAYLDAVEAGESPVETRHPREPRRALQEELFLGLRLEAGIDWECLRQEYGTDLTSPYENILCQAVSDRILEREGTRLYLTDAGVLISNELFQQFVDFEPR